MVRFSPVLTAMLKFTVWFMLMRRGDGVATAQNWKFCVALQFQRQATRGRWLRLCTVSGSSVGFLAFLLVGEQLMELADTEC